MTSVEVKNKLPYYQSLWNRGLVALFIVLFFLDGITRYKHIVTALMYITTVVYIYQYRKNIFSLFKTKLFYSLALFIVVIVYSMVISIDPSYSLRKFSNKIFEQLLVVSMVIPILLHRETLESVSKLAIYSLIAALVPLAISDGHLYYQEMTKGIMPFNGYEHKYISDALIFMVPALIYLIGHDNKKHLFLFTCTLPLIGFMVLGTMQRGTWLAILIPALIWCVVTRKRKVPALIAMVLAIILGVAALKDPEPFTHLFYKMQQTSSSGRYEGGTQGSAIDLIMENPIKGYGYGDNIFYNVYNSKVDQHPEWIFKKSIGPHNITLVYWYAAGILGLLALWYMLITVLIACVKGYRNNQGITRDAWLMLGMIMVGDFVVRGLFESVQICNLAIILGFAQTLVILEQKNKT